jgi:hypothetical protein
MCSLRCNDKTDRRIAEVRQRIPDDGDAEEMDRRTSNRHAYPVIQMIAPCMLFRPPEEATFHEVRCHDISRGGVSFFWSRSPDFHYVVIRLGDGVDAVSLRARVVRSSPIVGLKDEYLVCCEFFERVE